MQLFQPIITEEYDQLKPTYTRVDEAVNATMRLNEYCTRKHVKPTFDFSTEGKPPSQVFTCTITLRYLKVSGQGRNKQHAKNA